MNMICVFGWVRVELLTIKIRQKYDGNELGFLRDIGLRYWKNKTKVRQKWE